MTSNEILREIKHRLNAAEQPCLTASIAFEVAETPEHRFTARYEAGSLRIEAGGEAELTIRADELTWTAVLVEQDGYRNALLSNRLKLDGDVSLLLKIPSLLTLQQVKS